ncbi:MAG: GTPase, partial [Planctomycetaceae bacterium]
IMTELQYPTRVCVLTPEGRGAVSVVRVWGSRGLEVADAAFRPVRGARLADAPPGRLRLGRMGAGPGDEVVAVVVAGAGERPEVEVHCHGGPAPVALVVEALVAAGAERRQPVAWVRHEARSTIAAEAQVDLARAPTVRAAEILLEQAQGALEDELRRLLGRLDDRAAARDGLASLLRRAEVGLRLVSGWRVVLAGRPNVGKSRLLNALAGFERAIVDPTPGTTRDIVTVRTAFDGWPVELADTAGLRTSADAIEASGIALARSRQGEADLVLVVLDRSEPLHEADRALLAAHPRGLVVTNKADLPAAWGPGGPEVPTISAQRGDGLEALASAIARRLVPDPPPPGSGVPFRPAQARRLDEIRRLLDAGDVGSARRLLTGWQMTSVASE